MNKHWFQYVSGGVLALFFGIMTYVTFIAFSRHSGSTGMDMSKIQKERYDHQQAAIMAKAELLKKKESK